MHMEDLKKNERKMQNLKRQSDNAVKNEEDSIEKINRELSYES